MRVRICAFTLMEVLVVMVILGLLTALLLPVFERARVEGRKTHAASNLRQLYIGLQLYVESNGGSPGGTGTLYSQGYPTAFQWDHSKRSMFSVEYNNMIETSPCGRHPDQAASPVAVYYFVDEAGETERGAMRRGIPYALFADPNCSDPDARFFNPFDTKLLISIDINGSSHRTLTKEHPAIALW